MVDGGGLENHCTGNRTGGSNPSPSATLLISFAPRALRRGVPPPLKWAGRKRSQIPRLEFLAAPPQQHRRSHGGARSARAENL